jgi:D-lactate dehydrogenase
LIRDDQLKNLLLAAVALMFALNRHLHNSYLRVMQGNYALSGLVGNQMFEKTVGVVGTGAIGLEAVRILRGIGCKVLAYDIRPNPKVLELGATYMQIEEMLPLCDIITLHCPLLPSTYHLIDKKKIDLMKPGTMLINTSRGGLIDSDALFDGLESDHIGALGLDVYENESKLFFRDFTVFDSNVRMKNWDRRLKTLLTYPNVIVTPHSAFLTREALLNIAQTTIENISNWAQDKDLGINEVKPQPAK